MDLFEVLAKDERIIVYSDESSRHIYTWNQASTLQCWEDKSLESFSLNGEWEEISIKVLDKEPLSYNAARVAAINWSVE